jgi:signal transduction histidine kinase
MKQLELIEDHLRRLLSAGPQSSHKSRPGTVVDLLQSVEDLASPMGRHAGVRLEFESKTTPGIAVPDFDGIRSGLLNLVVNGIEAAGRGGNVAVSAGQDQGAVLVTVADSGTGPSADVADRIFEPFVTTKPEGVGLGLAFVRRTVEALGGSIRWEREGGTTRFVMNVPAANVQPAAKVPAS